MLYLDFYLQLHASLDKPTLIFVLQKTNLDWKKGETTKKKNDMLLTSYQSWENGVLPIFIKPHGGTYSGGIRYRLCISLKTTRIAAVIHAS